MTMKKVTMEELKKIGDIFGIKPCRVKGTDIVQIRKNPSDKLEDINWDEFEKALKNRNLVVYKSEKGNFLKVMKDR